MEILSRSGRFFHLLACHCVPALWGRWFEVLRCMSSKRTERLVKFKVLLKRILK
jgi:hypothetical protein